MKTSILALGLALLAAPLAVSAQSSSDYSTSAGDYEFTLSGNGASDKDVDNSSGGFGASVGYYLNDSLAAVVRQTFNFVSLEEGGDSWMGSTRLALDQHFGADRLRPFIGVNAGGIYGEDVEETLVAGIEGGLKFYVQPRTFLFARAEYGWAFEDSDDAADTVDDGGFPWTVGIGFNF